MNATSAPPRARAGRHGGRRDRRAPIWARLLAGLAGGLVAVATLAAMWWATGPRDAIALGVRIGTVDVAGQDRDAARAEVAGEVDGVEAEEVVIRLDAEVPAPALAAGHVLEFAPRLAELGVDVDVDAAIARAWQVGRSGDPLADLRARVRSFTGQPLIIGLPVLVDEARTAEAARALADDLSWAAQDAEVTVDTAVPTARVSESYPGGLVDAAALRDRLADTVTQAMDTWRATWTAERDGDRAADAAAARIAPITVGADPVAEEVTTGRAAAIAAEAEAVWAGQYRFLAPELDAADGSLAAPRAGDVAPEGVAVLGTLIPRRLAEMVVIRVSADDPVRIDPAAVADWAETAAGGDPVERWAGDPVNASATVAVDWAVPPSRERPESVEGIAARGEVVGAREGWTADIDGLVADLEAAPPADERVRTIPVEPVAPDVPTAEVAALAAPQPLGSFTTFFTPGQSRVINIRRFAELVNGTVVGPGEELELNDLVGDRTVEKGFAPGGAILEGEFVEQVGGGVSQFATTFFNAAFFAGADLLEHKPHSYYISRYPVGREATINYPTVDLRIANPSDQAFVIATRTLDDSVTVTVLGEPFATVEHATSEPTNRVPGELRDGFDVTVTRVRTFTDGTTDTEEFFHRYLPENQPSGL
ncbi:MAG: VanW family protein [Euzebyales bacterium]|nr:VanW family protein [Euzebyales bacterium]